LDIEAFRDQRRVGPLTVDQCTQMSDCVGYLERRGAVYGGHEVIATGIKLRGR
jgi:hypothetical protein